jgi:hypothetical protein
MMGASLQVLDDHGGRPSAAVADGSQAVLAAPVLEGGQQALHETGAAHADGVAHGDCAAVDVDLLVRDVQQRPVGEAHHGERLVELEEVDLPNVHPGAR